MRMLNFPVHVVKFSIKLRRSPLLTIAIVSVMAILLAVSAFVAKRSSAHDVKPVILRASQSLPPAVFRRMVGTYYNTEGDWKSTLILNNKGPSSISITPILYSLNGQRFEAPIVVVASRSPLELDLNALAQSAGPEFLSGSVEFNYSGRLVEVGGGMRIVNADRSLIFDESMLEPGMKFPVSQLESVFSIPFPSTEVSVIVTNTTNKSLTIDGQTVFAGLSAKFPLACVLGSHQSKVYDTPQNSDS